MYFGTLAITLSSFPVGEADVLLRVCSPDYGLLVLRQRSARCGSSRLKIFKEPGVFADAHCWGRPSDHSAAQLLTGRPLEIFERLRRDEEKLIYLGQALALTQRFLLPHDPKAEAKFLLLIEFLARLDSGFDGILGMVLLQLKMLELSGWKFSTSEPARQFLDAKMRNQSQLLEIGILPSSNSGFDGERLMKILDFYAQGLLEDRAKDREIVY
ncbi:MAG: hypothetical protein HY547_03660 [Elusimicrobia bacterium]|nr:hypothetical protein [Elusimicrobiota bacterium]